MQSPSGCTATDAENDISSFRRSWRSRTSEHFSVPITMNSGGSAKGSSNDRTFPGGDETRRSPQSAPTEYDEFSTVGRGGNYDDVGADYNNPDYTDADEDVHLSWQQNTFGTWGRGGGYTLSASLGGATARYGLGTNGVPIKRRKNMQIMWSICETMNPNNASYFEEQVHEDGDEHENPAGRSPHGSLRHDRNDEYHSYSDSRYRDQDDYFENEFFHDVLPDHRRRRSRPDSVGEDHTGFLALCEVADLLCQMLAALKYVHGCGVVHFDLKPDNFLCFFAAGGCGVNPNIKLADFGMRTVLSGVVLQ